MQDVDHAFQVAVVMRAGLGARLDRDSASPEFLGSGGRMADGGFAIHAGGLRRVRIELAVAKDPYAGLPPVGEGIGHWRMPIFSVITCPSSQDCTNHQAIRRLRSSSGGSHTRRGRPAESLPPM